MTLWNPVWITLSPRSTLGIEPTRMCTTTMTQRRYCSCNKVWSLTEPFNNFGCKQWCRNMHEYEVLLSQYCTCVWDLILIINIVLEDTHYDVLTMRWSGRCVQCTSRPATRVSCLTDGPCRRPELPRLWRITLDQSIWRLMTKHHLSPSNCFPLPC